MHKAKSFALAYKLKDNSTKKPGFDAHINFWNIPKNDKFPFIDFGIKITDFEDVEKITFSAPFNSQDVNFVDLSHTFNLETSKLIFGYLNCIFVEEEYASIKNGTEKNVFLPLKHKSNNADILYGNVKIDSNSAKNFYITIDISEYQNIPSDATSIYFRFRIKSSKIIQTLLKKLHEKNYYLESAFIERQIIDIKFNDARNIDRVETERIKRDNYTFANFKSVHLFLMVPSSFEVTIWDDFSECRQLENGWKDYLIMEQEPSDIIVYHWQKKDSTTNDLDKFTQLIKMEHKDTNKKLILLYCVVVIVLGALGSGLATFFENLF